MQLETIEWIKCFKKLNHLSPVTHKKLYFSLKEFSFCREEQKIFLKDFKEVRRWITIKDLQREYLACLSCLTCLSVRMKTIDKTR